MHEHTADYQTLILSGSPEEIGRTQTIYLRLVATPFRRNPWEENLPFLRACGSILKGIHPPLWTELAAFADALDMPLERGLFVRAGTLPHGCSAFAWALYDGRVIAGRNYDFYERMPTRHLLITRPAQGYGHIGMNGGLVGGRYDGINEHGLFVALHKVMTNRPADIQPGVPYHLVLRLALETCATAREAAAMIAELPHLAPFNYTLADGSGACFAVETYPGELAQVRMGNGGIAVANHYESTLAPLQGHRKIDGSQIRVATMQPAPAPWEDPWQTAIERLSDHDSGLCCHREFSSTLWSGVFDLTSVRAAYAFGPPCRNEYRPVAVPRTTNADKRQTII